ncbi:MAG: hypothetical protein WCH98_10510, partial [Verrucomicrobiota bacterium]
DAAHHHRHQRAERAVLENLMNPAPPARRVVGKHARLLWALARVAPASFRERVLGRMFLSAPSTDGAKKTVGEK